MAIFAHLAFSVKRSRLDPFFLLHCYTFLELPDQDESNAVLLWYAAYLFLEKNVPTIQYVHLCAGPEMTPRENGARGPSNTEM